MRRKTETRIKRIVLFLLAAAIAAQAVAQTGYGRGRSGLPRVELPDEPWIMNTHLIPEVKVSVVARGINRPWSLTFLPKGDMLITERGGALRMVRDGVLVEEPVAGVPDDVLARSLAGMMEVAVHPHFADNGYVYLTYTRQVSGREGTVALVRGRLDGMSLVDVEDVFVAEPWGGSIAAARLAFVPGEDIMYMTMGGAFGADLVDGTQSFFGHAKLAQDPNSHAGKTLRLRLDGSVPDDNPFVGKEGHKPEVYSMGHRNQMGLALHPETHQPWTTEHAPQGGDELNAIEAGKNYGWPVVSYGRHYNGVRISERFWAEGHGGTRDLLAALDRTVRAHVLHRRRLPRVEGQPVRRRPDDGTDAQHRPPRTAHLQRSRRGARPRVAAEGDRQAHPRRPPGPRRVHLRHHRRDRRRAVEAGTGGDGGRGRDDRGVAHWVRRRPRRPSGDAAKRWRPKANREAEGLSLKERGLRPRACSWPPAAAAGGDAGAPSVELRGVPDGRAPGPFLVRRL